LFSLGFSGFNLPFIQFWEKCCSATVKLEPKRVYHNIPSAYVT
jgi:hypothetical protein